MQEIYQAENAANLTKNACLAAIRSCRQQRAGRLCRGGWKQSGNFCRVGEYELQNPKVTRTGIEDQAYGRAGCL